MTNQLNQFEAAKIISETLLKVAEKERELVIRWASESVGLKRHRIEDRLKDTSSLDKDDAPSNDDSKLKPHDEPGSAIDIKTFVQEKDPTSNNQFAAVVAYYHRFVAPESSRMNSIKAADLIEATRKAGRARMSNPGDTLKKAMQQGYLDQVGRGEYGINTVGENLVALTLPSSSAVNAKRKKPARKAKKIVKKSSKGTASKKAARKTGKKASSRSRK